MGRVTPVRRPRPQLTYVRDPLQHEYPNACDHGGSCGLDDTDASCACAVNRTWCYVDCGCNPSTCQRMFQGCRCLSRCDGRCPCRQISFDCIPDRCGCACGGDPSPKFPRFRVRPSEIAGAGDGLYAEEDIPKNAYLGKYDGELVVDIEYNSRIKFDNKMTCMALSKCRGSPSSPLFDGADDVADHSIDGASNELMVFMNHQPKSRVNARFAYERGSKGKEIRVYSTKLIRAGQEVFIFYGVNFSFQPCPLPPALPYHDLEIRVGAFVFVRNETSEPWIGHVTAISSNMKEITVDWMCKARDIKHTDPYQEHRCPDELFLTPVGDQIEVDTIEDIAQIDFHHDGRHDGCHDGTLCWRQLYNPDSGQFTPERLLVPACTGARRTYSKTAVEDILPEQAHTLDAHGHKAAGDVDPISAPTAEECTNVQEVLEVVPASSGDVESAGPSQKCSFARYCFSTLSGKAHWTRHVIGHLQLEFYRCDIKSCNPDSGKFCEFKGKYNFVRHLRRHHRKTNRQEIEATARRCWARQREPPHWSRCGFCGQPFAEKESWNNCIDHVWVHLHGGARDLTLCSNFFAPRHDICRQ